MRQLPGIITGSVFCIVVLSIDRSPTGIVLAFWAFVLGYSINRRKFFLDLVPLTVLPIILLRVLYFILRYVYRVAVFLFSNNEGTIFGIPRTWREFLDSGLYRRELSTGRVAVAGWNRKRILRVEFDDIRHLMITGVTGEGKTTVALNIIGSLLAQGPKIFSKVHFSIHDPASVISLWFLEVAKVYGSGFSVYTDLEDSIIALENLVDEMKDRTKKLGEKMIEDVRQLGLPHKIILLDDPQWYYYRDKNYEKLVDQLVGMGRKAGFHVILLTPYGKGDVIATRYRANLRFISAYLPKHAETSVRMPVSQLRKHKFLYQATERDTPVIFQPYQVTPEDIGLIVRELVSKVDDPEVVALNLFMSINNCGIRSILEGGLSHYETLFANGLVDGLPFPWSEVSRDGVELKWSAAAYKWAGDFLADLTDKGIASRPSLGQARQPIVSYIEALDLKGAQ